MGIGPVPDLHAWTKPIRRFLAASVPNGMLRLVYVHDIITQLIKSQLLKAQSKEHTEADRLGRDWFAGGTLFNLFNQLIDPLNQRALIGRADGSGEIKK